MSNQPNLPTVGGSSHVPADQSLPGTDTVAYPIANGRHQQVSTFEAPQGIEQALFDDFVKDADTQAFVNAAHERGINDSQLSFIFESFVSFLGSLDAPPARSNNGPPPATQSDLEALMKSKAYMDPTHPDHVVTKERITRHFAQNSQSSGARRKPAPVIFQSG